MGLFSCIGNTIYFLVNLIFLVVGIACLVGGTILIISFDCTVEKLLYQYFTAIKIPSVPESISTANMDIQVNSAAIALLISGGVLVVFAMFAFLGTAYKALEKIVVFVYLIIAFVIMGCFIFAIVFFALPEKPEDIDAIKWTLKAMMPKYKPTTGKSEDFTIEGALVDSIQSAFHCCGVNGHEDYLDPKIAEAFTKQTWDMTFWHGTPNTKLRVPPTCCRTYTEQAMYPEDVMSNQPPVDVSYFPIPDNINATNCYTDAVPSAAIVHTARPCPATIYTYANDYQTAIIIAASVGTAVFLLLMIGLFVKLCSKSNDYKN